MKNLKETSEHITASTAVIVVRRGMECVKKINRVGAVSIDDDSAT
jgi:hypothetical protein